VQGILEAAVQLKPKALIIDSIQTIYLDGSTGTVGSVSQAGAPLPLPFPSLLQKKNAAFDELSSNTLNRQCEGQLYKYPTTTCVWVEGWVEGWVDELMQRTEWIYEWYETIISLKLNERVS
jgi:hypothetical protein